MLKKYIVVFIIFFTFSSFIAIKAEDNTNGPAEDTQVNTNTSSQTEKDTSSQKKTDYNKSDNISQKYGFTLQEEKETGYQAALILAKRFGLYDNKKVVDYVNNVGKKIAKKVSKRPGIDYQFYVLDTPEINAFATPGGFIFITKGAIKIMSDESELAGVLSHEIAHVEEGHGLEAIAGNEEAREKLKILKVELHENLQQLQDKKEESSSGIVNIGVPNGSDENYIIKDGELIIK